jgi:hypothetical protein
MSILFFKLIYFKDIKTDLETNKGFYGIHIGNADPLIRKYYYEYNGIFYNPLMILINYNEKYYLTDSYVYYQIIKKNGNIDPIYNIKLIGNILKMLEEYHNKFWYQKIFYNNYSVFFNSDSILKKEIKLSNRDLMKISNKIYWDSKKLIYPNDKYYNHEEYILDHEYKEIEKYKNEHQ